MISLAGFRKIDAQMRETQVMRKTMGRAKLTLIGLSAFGCFHRRMRSPRTQDPHPIASTYDKYVIRT